jgi:hypothetical protein
MVLHDVIFNGTTPIWMWILIVFNKFYKFHNVEVLDQDPCQQNEFKLTHTYKSKDGIWAMCTQFDLEVIYHLIFMNFRVKKLTIINTPRKNKTFDVWM